jgi:glycogen synthase
MLGGACRGVISSATYQEFAMRVLMTTDCVGGVWTYALELCRALGEHDVEVVLATMGPPPSEEQRRAAARRDNVHLVESVYNLEWMDEPWSDVRDAGRWLLELERRFGPNVVHLNGYAHGDLPWEAPVVVAAHSCVLSWWEAVKGEPAPPRWGRYREVIGAGLRAAQLVVAPTQAMLAEVERLYGPLRQARVIHNGRDPRRFYARDKEEFILAAGRLWDEAKNVAALDAVAGALPWPVCVAGADGVTGENGNGHRRHVLPLGRLESRALADWFSRAAIYALPARYEPFGLSALEAAMSGCALVLGDIPSLREVWDDAAVYVSPADHDALRKALCELVEDEALRRRKAAAAQARAGRFSARQMGDAYFMAYSQLVRPTSRVLVDLPEPMSMTGINGS